MLVLALPGAFTLPIDVRLILLGVLGIWMLVDLFVIPGMVNAQREQLGLELQNQFVGGAS